MQCSVCGSQDTKFVSGVSKKTGKPWSAYDCNEPECKNEKGYPNRTFSFTPKAPNGKSITPIGNSLDKKLDEILAILKANFKPVTKVVDEDEAPF